MSFGFWTPSSLSRESEEGTRKKKWVPGREKRDWLWFGGVLFPGSLPAWRKIFN